MPRQIQNFLVCFGNIYIGRKHCKDYLAETFVNHVGNGFGIPWHFAKGYDGFLTIDIYCLFYLYYIAYL